MGFEVRYQGQTLATVPGGVVGHEAPASIDSTGFQNVSAALTDWLNSTGQPGDRLRLRPGGRYWIPQGLLLTRPMTFDLNGAQVFTGLTLGDTDPNLEANKAIYPPLWPQHQPAAVWPMHRWCVCIASGGITIRSSRPGARIQGAGRRVLYLGGFPELPTGVEYSSALEGQAGIRIGVMEAGSWVPINDTEIDLTNLSVEFVNGDGISYFPGIDGLRIHGRTLGPNVVNANIVRVGSSDYLGRDGGLGGTIINDHWSPTPEHYPGIHHTGRQGFGGDFTIRNWTIEDISAWRIARSVFDIELSAAGARAYNGAIRRTETGHATLGWFTSAAAGSIEDLEIADNIAYGGAQINAHTGSATPARGRNWRILHNWGQLRRGTAENDYWKVDRIDGLEIRDNIQPVTAAGRGLDLGTSTGVVISPSEDDQFPAP